MTEPKGYLKGEVPLKPPVNALLLKKALRTKREKSGSQLNQRV
jgi:hypothetical protein